MRCKKTSHTLGIGQRLRILRTGKVFVYATGIKEHGTIIVSAVDADLKLGLRVAVVRVSPSDVPLWRLGLAVIRTVWRVHRWPVLAMLLSIAVAAACALLAHW